MPTAPVPRKRLTANEKSAEPGKRDRVIVTVPARVRGDLEKLAAESGRSVPEMARLSFSLLRTVMEGRAKGQRLVIVTNAGDPVKEILLPD